MAAAARRTPTNARPTASRQSSPSRAASPAYRRVTRARPESLVDRLMAVTALVVPTRTPFDGYGVVKSGAVAARAKTLAKPRFGIGEARARISGFIDGTFSPSTLQELRDYLSSRFMRLEERIFDGRTANFLVDKATREAVPAAAVDYRLSRPAMARRFGRQMEEEIEARRRRVVSPEERDARNLKARIGQAFHERRANGTPFEDWDDVAFSAPALFQNRELTVQGNEAWVGHVYARASDDPEENRRIVARAVAEGKKLVFPAETKDGVVGGLLVPGMPILLREGAVRTRFIDESLALDNMTRAYGKSAFDHFRTMGRVDAKVGAADEKVVQIDDFKRLRRVKAAPKVIATNEVASRCVVKHEIDADGREALCFLDPKTGEEYPFDPTNAPVGVFHKEDAFGLPTGYVQVGEDGGHSHFDMEERPHNPYGPATVPAKGAGIGPSWAIDGRRMSERDFARATAPKADAASLQRQADEREEREDYEAEGAARKMR